MNLRTIFLLLAVCGMIATACRHNHDHEGDHAHGEAAHDDHGHGAGQGEEETHDDHGHVALSRIQMETIKIELGGLRSVKLSDYVGVTGTLGLPPNAFATVSARAAGYVRESGKFVEGDRVMKGEVLAYLESPEFIQRQQEYLETSARLVYLEQEYKRQMELAAENAGVARDLQRTESEFRSVEARKGGLARQLEFWGIDPAGLDVAKLSDRIALRSPMTGFITRVNLNNGKYVSPEAELMEVISDQHLHLELDVFERDIARVKEHARITYRIPALGPEFYEGEVHVIGREFNVDKKTIRIHGHLMGDRPRFIKDLFVEARIWLNDETVDALPDGAIIGDGMNTFVFITLNPDSDPVEFEKLPVITGATDNGYTAVTFVEPLPEGAEIVTSGAFYVYSHSMAGEMEHDH